MSTYRNGDLPAWLLVRRGNFLLTRGTWAKWDALVADVHQRFGVTLRITDGVGVMKGTGAYRDLAMQGDVKAYFTRLGRPWQAAAKGTSSHGGEFKGADALAVDVTNYYLIPRAEFFAAARRAGFEPNFFDGRNGKPLEPWHLIDRDPYRAVPSPAGGNATHIPAPEPEEEDEDMDYRPTVHARLAADGKTQDEWMLGHPDIGKDLPVFDGTATDKNSRLSADKKVKTFRGFMVTVNRDIFTAWARTHGKGTSQITSSTDRDGYIEIQKELSRVSGELA
jgi:hypothetical protein